ncbi:dUTP diphosphatase [Neobacillus sedimentimangrovi]|uniref:dUTP diphosphatase n=1 Tax=Neobacillus sedimentimangrovi TaxID=2699460 RepID=A0ABS8QH73_9BACI|nr:dUTP diphosphatase [Neobacillus sedimentimangrovi]MCD4838150.1 dUTP diphosphatase [Neobacillus sedimentimangrovi]
MNLGKLFMLQNELDAHIEQQHPRKEGESRHDKKVLALLVELGELANEARFFKFWSRDQEPRLEVICHACKGIGEFHHQVFSGPYHTDDKTEICLYCSGTGIQKRPLLEEYVDCLHFILSIGLELNFTDIDVWKVKEATTTNQFIECFGTIYKMHFQNRVTGEVPREMYEHLFACFIGLGEMLGFTWEEIEKAYLAKNQKNHDRQDSGVY